MKANLPRGVGYIRAVLQDNNTECWNGEVEIERPTEWVSYYYPGIDLPEVKKCEHISSLAIHRSLYGDLPKFY